MLKLDTLLGKVVSVTVTFSSGEGCGLVEVCLGEVVVRV